MDSSVVLGPTLLDEQLPRYEFRGIVTMRMRATPAAVMHAAREVTTAEMPIATWLSNVRYLPSRLAGRRMPQASTRPFLDDLRAMNNIVLAERPDREIVVGMIGRLHDIVDQHPVPLADAEQFARFDEPNHQKLAMSIRVLDDDGGVRVVFEHRTHAIDRAARWKFALYWWLMIKWGSAVMSWMLLRAIQRRAETETAAAVRRPSRSGGHAGDGPRASHSRIFS